MPEVMKVICSCGKRTQVVWSEFYQKYVAQNKEWKFAKPGGWNCGKDGHYQKVKYEEEK